MKFKIAENHITGTPDQSGWGQVHDFTPVSEESFLKKGRLFVVISMVPGKDEILPEKENALVGREILTRLHEEYYNKIGDNFELLSKAVEKVAKDFSSPRESVSLLAAIVLQNKIIIKCLGRLQGWIIRKGNVAKIVTGENSAGNSVSGPILNNDVFFLATNSFFERFTPDALKTLENFDSLDLKDSTLAVLGLKLVAIEEVKPVQGEVKEVPKVIKPVKGIGPVRTFIAGLIDKILQILPSKNFYVKEELISPNGKRYKRATIAGAVLLGLLLLSILFAAKQKGFANSRAKYEPIIASIIHNISDAESLKNINGSEAQSLLEEAKNSLQSLESQKVNDPRLISLSRKIEDDLGSIVGVYEEVPQKYLDLTLQASNFIGNDISASEDRMIVLDRTKKILISIDIGSSTTSIVAGPDTMPNAEFIAAYSDSNFVSATDGIWEVGARADKVIQPVSWGDSSLLAAYTGNIYILDKVNSAIWKFNGNAGIYSSKVNWFGPGVKPDLSNVISWTFDGNIWVLTKEGTILKFTAGSPVDFSVSGINSLTPVDIFTTQDSKYLYLLDQAGGKVIVLNKNDGSYKAQYVGDNIKGATKLVVSETNKKIILLEGSNLFSLDIKHL